MKKEYKGEPTNFLNPINGKPLLQNAKSIFSNETGFLLWKQISGHDLTDNEINDLLNGKATGIIEFKKKDGTIFTSRLKLNDKNKVVFYSDKKDYLYNNTGFTDPNGGEILENDKIFINKERNLIFWKNKSGHILKIEELIDLLSGKIIGPFDDFYSEKKNTKFSAKLKLDHENKIIFDFSK